MSSAPHAGVISRTKFAVIGRQLHLRYRHSFDEIHSDHWSRLVIITTVIGIIIRTMMLMDATAE